MPAKIALKGTYIVELKEPSSIVVTTSETYANSSVTTAFFSGPDAELAIPETWTCDGRKTNEGTLTFSFEATFVTDTFALWLTPAVWPFRINVCC